MRLAEKLINECKIVLEGADSVLTSKDSMNNWANSTFKSELSKFKEDDVVWLQDKKSKYQGYYFVRKGKFNFMNTTGSGVDNANKIPVLKESLSEGKGSVMKPKNESTPLINAHNKALQGLTELRKLLKAENRTKEAAKVGDALNIIYHDVEV